MLLLFFVVCQFFMFKKCLQTACKQLANSLLTVCQLIALFLLTDCKQSEYSIVGHPVTASMLLNIILIPYKLIY